MQSIPLFIYKILLCFVSLPHLSLSTTTKSFADNSFRCERRFPVNLSLVSLLLVIYSTYTHPSPKVVSIVVYVSGTPSSHEPHTSLSLLWSHRSHPDHFPFMISVQSSRRTSVYNQEVDHDMLEILSASMRKFCPRHEKRGEMERFVTRSFCTFYFRVDFMSELLDGGNVSGTSTSSPDNPSDSSHFYQSPLTHRRLNY